jgi:predicted DNA-binding transcriptional regulator YafY
VAKIRELVRYEDKYSPDLNVEYKLTGRGYKDELPHPVEVVIQISGRVSETFFKENNPNDFRELKELGYGDVLVSYTTSNIQALLRLLKAWLPDVEVLSPDWVRYKLKRELQTYLNSSK